MAENRKLNYTVELNVDYFRRRLEDIHKDVISFSDAIKRVNSETKDFGGDAFSNAANGADKLKRSIQQVGNEAQKLRISDGFDEKFEQMTRNASTLRSILRELNKEKEITMRGGFVKDADTNEIKSLGTILAQIKAVKNEIKQIGSLDIDKIIDTKAKANFQEVTSAIKEQERALNSLMRSMERRKALSQSTYNLHKKEVDESNAILRKHGLDTVGNPYSDWTKYLSQMKLAQEQAERIRRNVEETKSAVRARESVKSGDYHEFDSMSRAMKSVVSDTNKWTKAMERGRQLTEEEFVAAQKVSRELQKQAELSGIRNDRIPVSPLLQYSNVRDFNAASLRTGAGITADADGVRSYAQEIRKLQTQCEALYETYRRAPTQENLSAFARTRQALAQTRTQYEKYQSAIEGASRAESEWLRKGISHMQWIVTGGIIGAMMMAPSLIEESMKKVDAEMANIRQVIPQIEANPLDKSVNPEEYKKQIEALSSAMNDFIGIATKYGQSVDETLNSARSIGRMYGQGDSGVINTKIFTDQAAKMSVADAFSMEDATKGLEAAMSQWNLQTEDSNKLLQRSSEIIDIWTRAAHSGAASGQDISQAIQVAGAAAAQAGVSFQFFTSLVETGVRATARSGNEIGQALKSLFVTMGSGKVDKQLKLWGIKTREVGEDGVERVRSMEKQILDVSLAVSSTTKDTTKFLSAISGGRYQYSKIAAILKDYKEILRMQGVLNDGKTKGFADKQVAVQLDTVKRKEEQLKSELTNLFADIGRNGGFDTLKWIATTFRDITAGIRKMNQEAANGKSNILSISLTIGKILVGLTAISRLVPAIISRGYQGMAAFKTTMQETSGMKTSLSPRSFSDRFAESTKVGNERGAAVAAAVMAKSTEATRANTVAQNENINATTRNAVAHGANASKSAAEVAGTQTDTVSKHANTVATNANTTAEVRNTAQSNANAVAKSRDAVSTRIDTASKAAETVATNAASASVARNTVAVSANSVALRAMTVASSVATTATRVFSAACAAMGGPVGIAVTLLFAFAPALIYAANAEGEAANKTQGLKDKVDELTQSVNQDTEQIQRQGNAAVSIAEAYNNARKRLSEYSEGTDEHTKIEQQLIDMDETMTKILGDDAATFRQENGYNIEAIKEHIKASKANKAQVLSDEASKASADADATKVAIDNIKNRIDSLKKEAEAVKKTGSVWQWFASVVSNAKYQEGQRFKDEANKTLDEINNDTWTGKLYKLFGNSQESASDMWNLGDRMQQEAIEEAKNSGNTELVDRAIADLNSQLGELNELLNTQTESASKLQVAAVEAKNEAESSYDDLTNGVQNDRTPDNNNYGKEPRGEQGSSSNLPSRAHEKRQDFDYYNDQLKAIYDAAETQYSSFSSKGLDMKTALAIATMINGGQWDLSGISDVFRNGSSNPWDSAYYFAEIMKRHFDAGETIEEALKKEYPDIDWSSLDNERDYLDSKFNFKKNARFFSDPNDASDYTPNGSVEGEAAAMADRVGIPREIMLKVAQHESHFDQSAVSSAGAIGVMQLMPDTAKALGVNPYDLQQNLEGGAAYLKQMFDTFGNWNDALAAYNAGPGNINAGREYANAVLAEDITGALNNADTSGVSYDDIINAASPFIDETLENGSKACVEAVTKIGSSFSSFLQNELSNGVVDVDTLVKDAGSKVIPFDSSKVAAGDVIVYDSPSQTQAHVVIADGRGGYIGNSSSAKNGAGAVVHGSDYMQMDDEYPSEIIKTGSSAVGRFARRSRWNNLNDKGVGNFYLNPVTEEEYAEKNAKTVYENTRNDLERQKKLFGESVEAALKDEAIDEKYLISLSTAKAFWESLLKNAEKSLADWMKSNPGAAEKLGKDFRLVSPDGLKKWASAVNDPKLTSIVEAYSSSRDKISSVSNEYNETKANLTKKQGLMTPEEREDYEIELWNRERDLKKAGMVIDDPVADREYSRKILETLKQREERQQKELNIANEDAKKQLSEIYATMTKISERKKKLEEQSSNGSDVSKELKRENDELERQKALYSDIEKYGTTAQRSARKALDETNKKIKETNKELNAVEAELIKLIVDDFTQMFSDVLIEGKSFKDSMKSLWKDIGNMAMKALISTQLSRWGIPSLFSFNKGGSIPSKATGGTIPGYASGGQPAGLISGAGTGTSDSILAYLADKDRFVYLSNGEYVMTAEATKRIGTKNLDDMNYGKYASGGALSPIPYIPNLSPSVTKKAASINKGNPNAKMENLMGEQMGILKKMSEGKDGGGNVVILNTQADSASVMKALAKNPRMVQKILGGQKKHGFR